MTLSIGDGLDRADVNLTDWAADDCAGRAAVQLSRFALARLHYLEEHYGLVPSAECIVGPDSSPSRNPGRLAAGYSTGGEVWWSPGRPFMPVDMLPNCCGITVGRLLGSAEPLKEYYDRLDLASADLHHLEFAFDAPFPRRKWVCNRRKLCLSPLSSL